MCTTPWRECIQLPELATHPLCATSQRSWVLEMGDLGGPTDLRATSKPVFNVDGTAY